MEKSVVSFFLIAAKSILGNPDDLDLVTRIRLSDLKHNTFSEFNYHGQDIAARALFESIRLRMFKIGIDHCM